MSTSTKPKSHTKAKAQITVVTDSDVEFDGHSNAPKDADGLGKKYQKKSEREHVLDNPDTYIGSVERVDTHEYTVHPDGFIRTTAFDVVPGLYKLFDEAIVNSRDHVVRMDTVVRAKKSQMPDENENSPQPVTRIDVTCDPTSGEITICNDGNGIDVAMHPEYKVWIPELIFGQMRTSTNYDKGEKRIVGGKNGFGFKLVLIWSTKGSIETVDHTRGLKYTQDFNMNLTEVSKPVIKPSKVKPYTRIRFTPDYARLGLPIGLSPEMLALFHRRTYDIAAVTNADIRVTFNGVRVPLAKTKTISTFEKYVDTYACASTDADADAITHETASDIDAHEAEAETELEALTEKSDVSSASAKKKAAKVPRVVKAYEMPNTRWEYAVTLAPEGEFRSVSFVNGIYTSKGGKHVEYVIGKIVRKLVAHVAAKKKIDVKPSTIKEQLMLFLRCDIENPSFDSQTKDYMNTPSSSFGSSCDVSDAFIEKIVKMGVTSMACAMTELKDNKTAKKTDGSKSKTVRGIPKLVDANHAGGARAHECALLLCEGDSAKAGVVSGLSREDRNFFGVYPMKGKIMNVRGETLKRVSDNKEVAEIKKILGLEVGRKYTPEEARSRLRYGKVVFMTDQDLDGSHIKGLGINLFHSQWPTLAALDGFVSFMNTPILKARRSGKADLVFYNAGEFDKWLTSVGEAEAKRWAVKYYKGLGTSTSKEFREYFEQKRFVEFAKSADSDDAIDLVFNKKRAEDRKTWLTNYNRDDYLDTSRTMVTYRDFLDKEMKHFSKYDCERSIPNAVDGLKTSQRKILFAAFKKNLTKELKVAQFSGYVSEVSGYHHGEASLNGAIVGMAQTFVGSNNVNMLQPNGQFGTRLQGGHDSASERYIFTQLAPLTRALFMSEDGPILRYLDDDGTSVEPDHYLPILPMLLVNGAKGIGTGFSSSVMCYNVENIIDHVEALVRGASRAEREAIPLEPYYEGFCGTIEPFRRLSAAEKALTKGKGKGKGKGNAQEVAENAENAENAETEGSTKNYLIRGTHTWLDTYRVHVTELPVGTWTDDFKTHLESLIDKKVMVREYVDMSTDVSVDLVLTMTEKRADVEALSPTVVGIGAHGTELFVSELEKTLRLYTTASTNNMHAFDEKDKLQRYDTVHDVVEGHHNVRMTGYGRRRDAQLAALQRERLILSNRVRFIMGIIDGDIQINYKKYAEVVVLLDAKDLDRVDDEFKYLTQMPMESVTKENVDRLKKEHDEKVKQYEALLSLSPSEMWLQDLATLRAKYAEYRTQRVAAMREGCIENKTDNKKKKSAKGAKGANA